MRVRLFLLGLGAVMPLLISCGGGGGGGGLSGVMNVPSFVIPAGETRVVTGDLVVNSAADLVINGELKVTPGARVALYSEANVKINGPIGTVPGRGRGTSSRQEETPADLIMAGRTVEIASPVEAADQGGDIYITTLGEDGTITISQNITTKPGRDSTEREVVGGRAGSIHIGDDFAIAVVEDDRTALVSKPKNLTITATLITGRGGHGLSDTTGTIRQGEEGLLFAACSGGGNGGNVSIDTSQETAPTLVNEQVVLGKGGNAGSCGSAGTPLRARSGTSAGEAGQSLQVRLGSEGQGGGLAFRLAYTDHEAERGLPGHVFAAAGNGGPGGRGGETTVVFTSPPFPKSGASQIHLENGGNGGAATQQFQNGGRGGNVTIRVEGREDGPSIHSVALRNYANGGSGFSGCSASPTVRGSNGGETGYLSISSDVTHTVENSFRGGNGADGTPPGEKGTGGTFTRDGSHFPDGLAGSACNASGVSTLTFSEEEVSVFTNEEKTVTLTRTGALAQVDRDIQVTIRSEDGSVVLVRTLGGTPAKSRTITWPKGQDMLTVGIVGGVNIHNSPDIIATTVDSQFGGIQATLEVINSQRFTTVIELLGVNGTRIPIGTVIDYVPDGGRLRGIIITPPNSRCSSWHGIPAGSSSGSGVTIDGETVNALVDDRPCGYGTMIQPTGPTDP